MYVQMDMQMFLIVTPCKHRLYCRSFEDPEAEPTVAWTFYSKSLKSSYVTYITKVAYGHNLYSVTFCVLHVAHTHSASPSYSIRMIVFISM